MKKLWLAALLIAALTLAGCTGMTTEPDPSATSIPPLTEPMFESREQAFALYDRVTFTDTLETMTRRFGEPAEVTTNDNGTVYYWKDAETGSGVAAVFFDNGRLRSKLVGFEDIRQFGKISGAKGVANAASLSKDFDLTSVNLLLGGEGIEMIRVAQDSSVNPDFNIGYIWADEDGRAAMVLFNKKGTVEQVSFSQE